ncbi:MAG: hypothetical protein Ct9H300mP21_06140 [Pseudomonadota bacterium]|nr:MAG: hypothetical protein Ct9H300mP21_06140 [Pseudomonadota bacterium]
MDMRLRPGGDRAPLVQSLDEMEYYYTVSGELWERQSLIKAVPVAGTKQLGKDVMNRSPLSFFVVCWTKEYCVMWKNEEAYRRGTSA